LDASGETELDVFDMRDGLIEEVRNVIVVQVVHDAASVAMADDEAKVAQEAKLLG